MTKEKTARLIPNAIQIVTEREKVKIFSAFAMLYNVKKICLVLIVSIWNIGSSSSS